MDIHLHKIARHCASSGQPFKHGDSVVSLLRKGEEALVRSDYHEHNWSTELSSNTIAIWRTTYRDPQADIAQEDEGDESPLRAFFFEAVAEETRSGQAKAFLAAQLLRRQRRFRLLKEASQENEDRVLLFLDLNTDSIVQVCDPSLSLGELRQARTALEETLRSESEETAEASSGDPATVSPDAAESNDSGTPQETRT